MRNQSNLKLYLFSKKRDKIRKKLINLIYFLKRKKLVIIDITSFL